MSVTDTTIPILCVPQAGEASGTVCIPTWDDLVPHLRHHPEREGKDGLGFVPAALKPGSPAYRAGVNVEAITLAVLDLDDGTTLDELRPRLEPYEWMAYT